MGISKSVQMIEDYDWDELVSKTYGRTYCFQQQEGCKDRGVFRITIPCDFTEDGGMYDEIPEVVNGSKMGVKFKAWLERDPKKPLPNKEDADGHSLSLFWERNFYPDVYTVANDLHEKGLIEAGDYMIEIDW